MERVQVFVIHCSYLCNLITNCSPWRLHNIRFSTSRDGDNLIMVYEDDGCGIPDGEKKILNAGMENTVWVCFYLVNPFHDKPYMQETGVLIRGTV